MEAGKGLADAKKAVIEKIAGAEKILIGLGAEWEIDEKAPSLQREKIYGAYTQLYEWVKEKDYFVITTVTDGFLYHSALARNRQVAPCGNIHWRQCENACKTDIWEEGEVPDGRCPHCQGPLVPNTVTAEHYLEEGYLGQWKAYQDFLAGTLNRELLILELGAGFDYPSVIRWPFEKTVYLNRKAFMYRVHHSLSQLTGQIRERAEQICVNSVDFVEFCGQE